MKFNLKDSDFERFLEEEWQYLTALTQPQQYDNDRHIIYVKALEALEAAE